MGDSYRKAKINGETILLDKDVKNNPKMFFQYVNTKLKPKENISNLFKEDGTLTSSNLEKKYNDLNNFFVSVLTTEDEEEVPTFTCNNNNFISTMSITEQDTEKTLSSLKVNKSPGPDGFHPWSGIDTVSSKNFK